MIDRLLTVSTLALVLVVEPVCHALCLPHPEGLAQALVNQLAVRQGW